MIDVVGQMRKVNNLMFPDGGGSSSCNETLIHLLIIYSCDTKSVVIHQTLMLHFNSVSDLKRPPSTNSQTLNI